MRLALVGLLLGLSATLLAAPPTGHLVSGIARISATGGGGSFQPVLSGDGRFVAFVSQAGNLVPQDSTATRLNVFLHDRLNRSLLLVSVRTDGGGGGDGSSVGPVVSADGRYVAFQSMAGNLAPRDANGLSDVFLRDTVAGTTLLVSRELTGWASPDRMSMAPLLSSNGRWLVYESAATNLVANDTNGITDHFVYDRLTGSNALASSVSLPAGIRALGSSEASLSADGRRLAFILTVSDGLPGPPMSHVLLRDLEAGQTVWASAGAAADLGGFVGAGRAVLSADGRAVFFHAWSPNATNLYRYTPADNVTLRLSPASSAPGLPSPSADGVRVAFESNGVVRVVDTLTLESRVASVTRAGDPAPSPEGFSRPVLSADGSRVCFLSQAGGLTADPTNGLVQLYLRDMAGARTWMLSRDFQGAAAGDHSAIFPSMSADATVVAFESSATSLVPEDFNQAPDVFVREVEAGTVTLVSARDPARPGVTGVAASWAFTNGASADGRYVLYACSDNGLFPGDTNGVQDLFVRDLLDGTVEPVTIGAGGEFTNRWHIRDAALSAGGRHAAWTVPMDKFSSTSIVVWRDLDAGQSRVVSELPNVGVVQWSCSPAISADGRWVAFQSTKRAGDLEPGVVEGNGESDIILHDVRAGTNTVISRRHSGSTTTARGRSYGPRFSPDGRWLAFVSTADDLTADSIRGTNLFVRDLWTGTTLAARPALSSRSLDNGGAVFSRDSRQLAYSFLHPGSAVAVYDLMQRTGVVEVLDFARHPSLDAQARLLAYEENLGVRRVVLLDRATGVRTVISTNTAELGAPLLSGDGRYLVCLGWPLDLGTTASMPHPSLMLYSVPRRTLMPLPVSLGGDFGNGPSYLPQLTADGRTLVFTSFATDIVPGDYNDRCDVFVLQLGGADTDGDGLDDDFELAYFGDLSRDGSGDADRDGHTDRDEFLAGTDPTDQGSILRVLTVHLLTGNSVKVLWEAVPGRRYEVQYLDGVGAGWSVLPGQVLATSMMASAVDETAPRPPGRFYRVKLQP